MWTIYESTLSYINQKRSLKNLKLNAYYANKQKIEIIFWPTWLDMTIFFLFTWNCITELSSTIHIQV